jgi:hypothetical protein
MNIPPGYIGREYRSKATLWGLPLVHVATGIDPITGRKRIAKGIIACGDVAIGVVAVGGMAFGGIAFGGLAIGGLAIAGCAIGLIGLGGCAIGLLLAAGGSAIGGVAVGGGAFGGVAVGGGAVGYYAYGGGGVGVHVWDSGTRDPAAVALVEEWGERLVDAVPTIINALVLLGVLIVFLVYGINKAIKEQGWTS